MGGWNQRGIFSGWKNIHSGFYTRTTEIPPENRMWFSDCCKVIVRHSSCTRRILFQEPAIWPLLYSILDLNKEINKNLPTVSYVIWSMYSLDRPQSTFKSPQNRSVTMTTVNFFIWRSNFVEAFLVCRNEDAWSREKLWKGRFLGDRFVETHKFVVFYKPLRTCTIKEVVWKRFLRNRCE